MVDLKNKVAVVTGGTNGIGRATAILLAEHGARVVVGDVQLADENRERFAELEIREVTCDVRSERDVEGMIREAASVSGRIDIIVNNAGVSEHKQITEVTEAEWDRCLDTNLKGAFLTCKHAIPLMRPEGGSIINVSSNAGLLPRAHDPVYSISKAALVGLTKALALCHSTDKIRINCVCPGPVGGTVMMNAGLVASGDPEARRQTLIDASPLARAHERMISPEEIAQAVLYLASEASAMVTGTSVAIDGGKSLGVPPKLG
jgi:NAD(P)-dependent dehydrogenase (short-subunit alcohol dehydrogenase family)